MTLTLPVHRPDQQAEANKRCATSNDLIPSINDLWTYHGLSLSPFIVEPLAATLPDKIRRSGCALKSEESLEQQ